VLCAVTSLAFGLVCDRLGSCPHRTGGPVAAEAGYEPEETPEVPELAVRRLGHRPLPIDSPRAEVLAGGSERPGPA
jgi:hypothetical protein